MSEHNTPEYITFPRTFENYRWYKPILVFIIGAIVYVILQVAIFAIFGMAYGWNTIFQLMTQGYEALNSEAGSYIGYLSVAIFLPSLYIATKIVRDRPTIPLAVYLIYEIITSIIHGPVGPNTLTVTFFVICLIIIPLQCIAEEYFLRGLVMQTFGSWFKIPIVAIILQSVIFASMHPYSILGVVGVLIQGILLGFLTWRSNGLEASSALHCVNNLTSAYFTAIGFEVTSSIIGPFDFASTIIVKLGKAGSVKKPRN